jgi:Domain of unknown function (DUF305)
LPSSWPAAAATTQLRLEVELIGQQNRRRVHSRHDRPPPGRHRDGQVRVGRGAALRKLAKDIISAQTQEIAQMKQWRKACYGSPEVSTDMSSHGSMDDMNMGS